MIAGVHSIDLVLLVVDAREGWMAQTQEHLCICEALGIVRGIVVITRSDLADSDIVDRRVVEVSERLQSSSMHWLGPIVTSVRIGHGMDELIQEILDAVSSTQILERDPRFRMYVDRVFDVKGRGVVVTGTVDSGSLPTGSELSIGGETNSVRVREIQSHGYTVEQALPRQRYAMNVVGPDVGLIRRGTALVSPGDWESVKEIDAVVSVLPTVGKSLRRRGAHLLHIGTSMQAVSLSIGGSREIKPSEKALVRVVLRESLPLRRGDRFVLRDASHGISIAGGRVLEIAPTAALKDSWLDQIEHHPRRPHGWTDVSQWWRRTGQKLPETFDGWFVDPQTLKVEQVELLALVEATGLLDISSLDKRARHVLKTLPSVKVVNGIASLGGSTLLEGHPIVQYLRSFGIEPPDPRNLDAIVLSQMVRSGVLQEAEGRYFTTAAILEIVPAIEEFAGEQPDGFTLAQLRDHLQTSRRTALAIGEILDRMQVTKRAGDRRVLRGRN
jgi:selenocysteine-specific elongation factor